MASMSSTAELPVATVCQEKPPSLVVITCDAPLSSDWASAQPWTASMKSICVTTMSGVRPLKRGIQFLPPFIVVQIWPFAPPAQPRLAPTKSTVR